MASSQKTICGLQGDRKFWGSKGLGFGVENGNGALVALVPVPSFSGICDYYWHGHADLGMWNRIVTGSDQGCDNDISTVVTRVNQLPLGKMYTKGMVMLMQMTDELLNEDHQAHRNGGDATLRSSRGKDGSRECQNITNGAKLAEGARLYAWRFFVHLYCLLPGWRPRWKG